MTNDTNPALTTAENHMMTCKPGAVRDAARSIVRTALANPTQGFYPDEVENHLHQIDANCIGIAFRNLSRVGVIRRGNTFRASKRKSARGRTVFAYELADAAKAETFLRDNPEAPAVVAG